jgi:hypothetical protein
VQNLLKEHQAAPLIIACSLLPEKINSKTRPQVFTKENRYQGERSYRQKKKPLKLRRVPHQQRSSYRSKRYGHLLRWIICRVVV